MLTDVINTGFDDWLKSHLHEIAGAYKLLSIPMSNDIAILSVEMRKAEAIHSRMWALQADAEAYHLLQLSAQWDFVKSNPENFKGMTSEAKESWVKANAVVPHTIALKLKGIVKSLEQRVMCAMSMNRAAHQVRSE